MSVNAPERVTLKISVPQAPDMRQAPTADVKTRTEDILAVNGLVKRYGERTVVDGVTFNIRAGETFGLLGPTGPENRPRSFRAE
jgi:ABC-type glutathione transport system ATPase component